MVNNDMLLDQKYVAIVQKVSNAAKEGKTEDFESGLTEMFQAIETRIIDEANKVYSDADRAVLAQRGIRQLTSDETKFYNRIITEMKKSDSGNPMMALTNTDKLFPETMLNSVMDDMVQAHPLLDAIDMQNVSGMTKWFMNTDAGDKATWGDLTDAVAKEIASGFKEIDMTQKKLSAFIPIDNSMLDLGPVYLDSYIRTCLSEALALGYENAVITGTGLKMPIGMDRQVQEGVTVTGGVYPQKTAIAVTSFSRENYGALCANLAKTEYGKSRILNGLVLVCNPTDYFKLVMPATTLLTPEGQYVNNVLPYPTNIVQSVAVTSGTAIHGIGKKYKLGVGGNRGVQFSDDYKFIEDKRYYKIVAYGNGRAQDNTCFQLLDISKLTPTYLEVKQITD